jgi:hypothetical protein
MWLIAPLVPVTVSDNAQGIVLVVVFIVRVEEPEPLMTAGLKPPLVMPGGTGFPPTLFTVPVNRLPASLSAKAVDPPGTTSCAAGPTVIEKSGVVGSTVIVRVSGLGSVTARVGDG